MAQARSAGQGASLLSQDRGAEKGCDFEHWPNFIANLDREQSARIQTGAMHRSIQGAQSEDLVGVVGEQVMGAFRLRIGVDRDVAFVPSVRSPAGVVGPFHGVLASGEASVRYEWEDGMRLEGTLYGSKAGPGAGAALARPDANGVSELRM